LALRAWLALERRLFGRRGVHPIGPDGLGQRVAGPGTEAGEVVLDLASSACASAAAKTLSLRFDGERDEAALFGALQARRAPLLQVVDGDGQALAASYPAVEVRDELGRSLSYVHARLLALVLRAVGDRRSPAVPPPAAASPARATLAAFAAHALSTKVRARLSRSRSTQETWQVALRPAPSASSDGPPHAGGFHVEPGPADAFHADPFLFAHEGETYLFVETYPWSTRKGVIACAKLGGDGRPSDFETVLEAPHHLSYPQVFAHEGEVYMLPETAAARRLELYRATDFPRGWERAATLLDGLRIADATLLAHEGRWWLFASLAEFGGASQDELFAWHGPSPLGPWSAHACNPLVSDVRNGRPGGRFVRRGSRLYRPAQDSEAGYGSGLAWREVAVLTPDLYREAEVVRWRGTDFGPYLGVHSFSEAGGWEAIDLKRPRQTR
jgi:hypothetical protein